MRTVISPGAHGSDTERSHLQRLGSVVQARLPVHLTQLRRQPLDGWRRRPRVPIHDPEPAALPAGSDPSDGPTAQAERIAGLSLQGPASTRPLLSNRRVWRRCAPQIVGRGVAWRGVAWCGSQQSALWQLIGSPPPAQHADGSTSTLDLPARLQG